MADRQIALIDQPDRVRLALSPMRRQLLERLRTPASASQIAAELTIGRQRVNYHLRALEKAGLLELVEERQRRGCTERVLVTRAKLFVVDPTVVNSSEPQSTAKHPGAAQDRFAVEHLINSAAATVRDVARMQARAQEEGTRLLTVTIDTELSFPTPADLERFADKLADFVAREAAALESTPGNRRYRLVIGAHPAPARNPTGVSDESDRSRLRRSAHRRPH